MDFYKALLSTRARGNPERVIKMGDQERKFTFSEFKPGHERKGGMGYVFKATAPSKEGKTETFAIKTNINSLQPSTDEASKLDTEIRILEEIKHKTQMAAQGGTQDARDAIAEEGANYILEFHGANKTQQPGGEINYEIITEYCDNPDLLDYVIEKGPLPEQVARTIMTQLLQGLHFLHSIDIVHRDIKPDNIMIRKPKNILEKRQVNKEEIEICIIDFGFAKQTMVDGTGRRHRAVSLLGSPGYISPEIASRLVDRVHVHDRPYDGRKHDVWCAGIVLLIMLTQHNPFKHDTVIEECQNRAHFDNPDKFLTTIQDDAAKAFLLRILHKDPDERPTAIECLRDSWITNGADAAMAHALRRKVLARAMGL